MTKAIIRNGAVVPMEPLPVEWTDGTEVNLEGEMPESADEIERQFDELDCLCLAGNEAEHQKLQSALDDADREAKTWMRREMGLPE